MPAVPLLVSSPNRSIFTSVSQTASSVDEAYAACKSAKTRVEFHSTFSASVRGIKYDLERLTKGHQSALVQTWNFLRLLLQLTRVIELLEHGADIESTISYGRTPLHFACYFGHVTVVNELRSRGANIETNNNLGNTPLHAAASMDHLAVARV
jgi:ankyrin repeat protein